MRKKMHRRINPYNKNFDKFYMCNYVVSNVHAIQILKIKMSYCLIFKSNFIFVHFDSKKNIFLILEFFPSWRIWLSQCWRWHWNVRYFFFFSYFNLSKIVTVNLNRTVCYNKIFLKMISRCIECAIRTHKIAVVLLAFYFVPVYSDRSLSQINIEEKTSPMTGFLLCLHPSF